MEELHKGLIKGSIGEFEFLDSKRGEIANLKSEKLSSENAIITGLESESISSDTISTGSISSETITSDSISSDAITSGSISSESVTSDTISVGEILLNGTDITESLDVKELKINGISFDPDEIKSFGLSQTVNSYDIVDNGLFPTEEEDVYEMRSNYLPDASFYWRDNHQHFENNHIVKLINGVCYNENDEAVCKMETNKILKCGYAVTRGYSGEYGNGLFHHYQLSGDEYTGLENESYINKHLISIESDFDGLVHADDMFRHREALNEDEEEEYFYKLKNFKGSMINLTSAIGMFYKNKNLITFESNIPSLTLASYMFYQCENLTNFSTSGDYFVNGSTTPPTRYSTLEKLIDGSSMFEGCLNLKSVGGGPFSSLKRASKMFFNCGQLTYTYSFYSVEYGDYMFGNCLNLRFYESDFKQGFNNLVFGEGMFLNCVKMIKNFTCDMPSLKEGKYMFKNCSGYDSGLETFVSDIPNLENGEEMFMGCSKLKTFHNDVPSLTDGRYMFSDCSSLTEFIGSTANLKIGLSMFFNCTELKKFVGDLSSLEDGDNMFSGCKLDSESLSIIIDTIQKLNYLNKKDITIGLDCLSSKKDDFAKEIGFDTMDEIIAYLDEKGWATTIEYNIL